SNWYSSLTSTSATTTASFFLCTSIPAILYGIGFLLAGAESVPQISLSRVSGYRRSHRGRDHAPFIRSITHAPDHTLLRPRLLHCQINLAAPAIVEYYPALGDFHLVSRAAGPTSHFGKRRNVSTRNN